MLEFEASSNENLIYTKNVEIINKKTVRGNLDKLIVELKSEEKIKEK